MPAIPMPKMLSSEIGMTRLSGAAPYPSKKVDPAKNNKQRIVAILVRNAELRPQTNSIVKTGAKTGQSQKVLMHIPIPAATILKTMLIQVSSTYMIPKHRTIYDSQA